MEKEEKIIKEVEKTITVFDNLKSLKPNPFLYTRIKSEIDRRALKEGKKLQLPFALKPVTILVILLLNIITAIYFFGTDQQRDTSQLLINELKVDYQISQTQIDL